jgi:23S rRNA (uracil1939-C5)-methyltransferase
MIRGDEVVLTVEGVSNDGKAVGRVEGFVVFVRGGAPGDEVRVKVTRARRRYAEAAIVELLQPSADRTEPRCRHFGVCGGCAWQHVAYGAQLHFKRQHVQESLEKIGGFTTVSVDPVMAAQEPFFYRNKMEFSFGERWLSEEEMEEMRDGTAASVDRFALGLHIPLRFDRVLNLEECWLQSEKSSQILHIVRSFCREQGLSIYSTMTHTGYLRNLVIRESKRTGERMVNLVTSQDNPTVMEELSALLLSRFSDITTICNNITERKSLVAVGERERVYHGPGYITEKLGNKVFRVSANSFFQAHTEQTERLYETVKQLASLASSDVVYDLYSGTGTIALTLSDHVAEVVGVESSEPAVADAQRNAALNGVNNCVFIAGDVKEKLTRDTGWLGEHSLPSVVVLDPPRAGAHEKVLQQILRLKPSRIVYVSCNPATQARDLAVLCSTGIYAIQAVQPVDMFPHTNHVENVVALGMRGQNKGPVG